MFQDCVSLSMQHSVFAVHPVHKTAFNGETWVLNTGATDHIIHSVTLFTKITSSISTFVQLPNGEKAIVTHIGTIQITSTLILENVLCVPSFSFNLISVSKLTKCLSCCFVFLSKFCFIQDLSYWKTIGVGKLHNNLYLLQVSPDCKSISGVSSILQSVFDSLVNSVSNVPVVSKPYLWHLSHGHVSDNKLSTLHNSLPDVIQFRSNKNCVLYPIAKKKKLHFPSFNHIFDNAFDIVHCDVWSPFVKSTQEGYKYFLTLVDDATRSTWVYLMKSKLDTRHLLVSFYNMTCTQFHTKIKVFRTDNAPEFFLKDFFAANRILH